jgi:predicted nucleotidyltransferase
MKSIKTINEILNKYKSELAEKYNVKEIGIFGSYARGDQRKTSDLDILVEFSEPIGWEFVDLKEFLESILSMKADLVMVGALKPQLRDSILQEVIYL